MEQRFQDFDWAATSLGARASWPQSLMTLVRVMLASRQPMFIAWGPQRVCLYNDSYASILGSKHPTALGRPLQDIWSEIWRDVAPFVDQVFSGHPVHMDDLSLTMHRHGYPEETHFAFSYTPIPDDAGHIEGLFCACTETTQQVMSSRAENQAATRLQLALKAARLKQIPACVRSLVFQPRARC
jgi:PAS domain-containing protein